MKKFLLKITFFSLLVLLLFSSCKPQNNLIYMRDIDEIQIMDSIANPHSMIQPGDQLGILISSQDMEAVAPFNQNFNSSQAAQYSIPSGNVLQRFSNVETPTYIVKSNESINFPIIGELSTKGLTVEKLELVLTEKMKQFIQNPTVQVRSLNYKITILGEVGRPGTFLLPDGQATLLSALGMAGDLTNFGVREDVLILRNENGKIVKHKIDLTSANLINSPVYYLKQNDVIYVKPNKTVARKSKLNPNNGLYFSIASLALSLAIFLSR